MKAIVRNTVPLLLTALVAGSAGAATVTNIPVTETQAGQSRSYAQSGQSQLLMLVQQLQEEVRQLRGMVETQQYQLEKMEREQRDRYRDVDRRISALIQATPDDGLTSDIDSAVPETSSQLSTPPASAQSTTPPSPSPSTAAGENEAYRAAFALVRERRFDEARSAFQAFIRQYPQSSNLANAHYWIGEIDLAQQSLASARLEFERVVNEFSGHSKVPDALYKLGVVEDRLGNGAASRTAFEQLLNQYPQSSAAGLARNYTASR